MARTCTVCVHENKHLIDQAIIAGRAYRAIANLYSVSKASIQRHAANHLPKQLLKTKKAKELCNADDIIESIADLEAGAKRIQDNAEKEKDFKNALSAIREQSRLLEFKAKLLGELNTQEGSRASINQIENVNIKALLLDPISRQALEHLSSKTGGRMDSKRRS
jgi:hypothetical protein